MSDIQYSLERAAAWIAQDPDAETRSELSELVDRVHQHDGEAEAELVDIFSRRLEFGTAGIRGVLGAGPSRMNRVSVSQLAAGLAAYLKTENAEPSVVVGYDARKNSRVFAHDIAEILAGSGIATTLLPRELPTPVLAFAVRHLNASAGVMVTASHNPAKDNGCKVYLGGADNGSQVNAPDDASIATEIARAAETPLGRYPRSTRYARADESVIDSYVEATAGRARPGDRRLRTVYTPLHGVGWETARSVFQRAGFGEPIPVASQQHPDAAFPTVAFPNPEEPGALDLAFDTARDVSADLIIANDPDADRLSVAIPTAQGWRRLSGNEVGLLLGWNSAEATARSPRRTTLATTIVSSPGLKAIADACGLDYRETLTGFKWISRVPGLLYGYEEALGYLVDPEKISDKDGISAAVDFLSLASALHEQGRTIEDRLVEMAERFGAFASEQISIRTESLDDVARVLSAIRRQPPEAFGSEPVERFDDFSLGYEGYPPSDIIRMLLSDGSRIVVRGSGTEQKLKAYIDTRCEVGSGRERIERASSLARSLAQDVRELLAGIAR
jgi:phosphomannomutase